MLEEDLFKYYYPNLEKLLKYGFEKDGDNYLFQKDINDSFLAVIKLDNNYNVKGRIIDKEMEEEYTNFRIEDNSGSFAGTIRQKFIALLIDIRDKCFYRKSFSGQQAKRICQMIEKKYGDAPIYKWNKYPDFCVFQNGKTNKWYALVMTIAGEKFNLNIDNIDNIDVINIKLDVNKIVDLQQEQSFYPAYHMNKKYWISILLDDSISDDTIMDLIDESYQFSRKK